MPVRRLALLIAALTGLFVLGVALSVAGLLALGDPGLLVVCLVAAFAALAAGVLAWLAVRAAAEEDAPAQVQAPPAVRRIATAPRRPVRIQSLPVADLPPAYLAAVMKGLQASRRTGGPAQRH